jgi:hypothetical protein
MEFCLQTRKYEEKYQAIGDIVRNPRSASRRLTQAKQCHTGRSFEWGEPLGLDVILREGTGTLRIERCVLGYEPKDV